MSERRDNSKLKIMLQSLLFLPWLQEQRQSNLQSQSRTSPVAWTFPSPSTCSLQSQRSHWPRQWSWSNGRSWSSLWRPVGLALQRITSLQRRKVWTDLERTLHFVETHCRLCSKVHQTSSKFMPTWRLSEQLYQRRGPWDWSSQVSFWVHSQEPWRTLQMRDSSS